MKLLLLSDWDNILESLLKVHEMAIEGLLVGYELTDVLSQHLDVSLVEILDKHKRIKLATF